MSYVYSQLAAQDISKFSDQLKKIINPAYINLPSE